MNTIKVIAVSAALMLSPAVAGAEWIARAKNNSGGLIVLLADKGNCSAGLRMYTAAPSGRSQWGCWIATDNHILVRWDDRDNPTTYDYLGWEVNPATPKSESGRPRGNNF